MMMFPLPKVKDFLQWCDWFLGVVWWPFCSFSSSAAWAWQVLNENKIIIIRNPYHRLSLSLLPWPWPPLSPLINIFATTGRIDNLLFSSLLFSSLHHQGGHWSFSLFIFYIDHIRIFGCHPSPLLFTTTDKCGRWSPSLTHFPHLLQRRHYLFI